MVDPAPTKGTDAAPLRVRFHLHGRDTASVAMVVILAVLGGVILALPIITDQAQQYFATRTIGFHDLPDDSSQANIRVGKMWTDVNLRSVEVIVADPTTDHAPPPLGLPAWPEPGHFLVSPDLATGVDELAARLGHYDGTLAPAYLPSASSRLVVYRPLPTQIRDTTETDTTASDTTDSPTTILMSPACTGCVSDAPGYISSARQLFPLPITMAMIAGVLLTPIIMVTCVVMAKVMRRTTDVTQALLAQGCSPCRLRAMLRAALIPGVTIGIAVGAVLLAVTFVVDIPIPLVQFTIRAIDMRRHGVLAVGFAALTAAVAVAIIMGSVRTSVRSRDPQAVNRPLHVTWRTHVIAVLSLVVTIGASIAYTRASISALLGENYGAIDWLMIGYVAAIVGAPAFAAEILALAAGVLNAIGRINASAACLIASRTATATRLSRRVVASAVIVILTSSVMAMLFLQGSVEATRAQRIAAQVDGAFLRIGISTHTNVDDLSRTVADRVAPLRLITVTEAFDTERGFDSATITIAGTPQNLNDWGLTTGRSTPVAALPRHLADTFVVDVDAVDVEQTSESTQAPGADQPTTWHSTTSLIVYDPAGSRVDRNQVTAAVVPVLGPRVNVGLGGENAIVGVNDDAFAYRWMMIFTTIAALLFLVAILVASAAQTPHVRHRVEKLETISGRGLLLERVTAVSHLVTILVTVVLGAALAWQFTSGQTTQITSVIGKHSAIVLIVIAVALCQLAVAVLRTLHARSDSSHDHNGVMIRVH